MAQTDILNYVDVPIERCSGNCCCHSKDYDRIRYKGNCKAVEGAFRYGLAWILQVTRHTSTRKDPTSRREQYAEEVLECLSFLQLAARCAFGEPRHEVTEEGIDTNASIFDAKTPRFERVPDERREGDTERCD